MKDGFIKVAAVTADMKVLDITYNTDSVIKKIDELHGKGVSIAVFPELTLSGLTGGDLLRQKAVLDSCLEGILRIEEHSSGMDMLLAVGAPLRLAGRIYDVCFVICNGEILCAVPKNHLTKEQERVFSSYFGENSEIELDGEMILFGNDIMLQTDCMEDLSVSVSVGEDIACLAEDMSQTAFDSTVILNPSSSIKVIGKAQNAEEAYASGKLSATVISAYCGPNESTTDHVYMCRNAVAEPENLLLSEKDNADVIAVTDCSRNMALKSINSNMEPFEGDYDCVEFLMSEKEIEPEKVQRNLFIGDDGDMASVTDSILAIQINGLAKRMRHTGAGMFVIGVSGGLDSCLALLVSAYTADHLGMDRKSVIAITLPSFGTTSRTKSNAQIICEELGTDFREIPIGETVKSHFSDIGHDADSYDAAYENAQARERTQVLMDIANMENGIVVGTGDLSELALGWATYNGDQMSNYGVNADIPKTVIQVMVREIAKRQEKTLRDALMDIVDTPISPELIPGKEDDMGQKTEDLVGPYELHDFFIYNILRYGYGPRKILRMAEKAFEGKFGRDVIVKWLRTCYRRFISQQFKRSAMPDGPKVFDVDLSPRGGFMMPSDAASSAFMEELEGL